MLLNKEGFIDSVEAKSARSNETHQLAAQNEMKNKKAHSAFGIREDYTPGAAFTEGTGFLVSNFSKFCHDVTGPLRLFFTKYFKDFLS